MKTDINIGIIGTGAGIRTHMPSFKMHGANIKAIVGKNYAKTREVALKHGIEKPYRNYRELCNDPTIDLVVIATPNHLHFEQIKYAIKKGKHILAEKPLVLTEAENEELIRLSSSKDKLFLVNHQLRFNPYLRKIRSIISSGYLGHIYFVKIHQQSPAFTKTKLAGWSFDSSKGGGVRLAMGSHLIDLILFFFPEQSINAVFGGMDNVVATRKDKTYRKDTNVSSFVCAGLNLTGNINVHLASTAASMCDSKFEINIYGSDGELQFNLLDKLSMSIIGDFNQRLVFVDGVLEEELSNEVSIFRSSSKYFAKSILDCIKFKESTMVTDAADFKDALNELIILEKIKTSAILLNQTELNENDSMCNCIS